MDINFNLHIDELNNRGITILKNFIPHEICDSIKNDYYIFKNNNDCILTENKLGSRLYNLHLISENALNLLFTDELMMLLDKYFGKSTALNSTIYFEEGSQQCIHRDTPYFWSEPYAGEFVGVWFAFEDTSELNGKLEYYPYGHKFKIDTYDFSKKNINNSTHELFDLYSKEILNLCKENNLELESPDIKKGDVIIWHADLPHGGSIIKNVGSSRHSLVGHYLPDNAYVQTIDYFFGRSEKSKIMDYIDSIKNRRMRNVNLTSFAINTKCNDGIE